MSRRVRVPHLRREVDLASDAVAGGYDLPLGWNFSLIGTADPKAPWRCTYCKLAKYRQQLLSFEGKSLKEIAQECNSNHSWGDYSRLHPDACEQLRKLKIP